jgi:hypothetical protein
MMASGSRITTSATHHSWCMSIGAIAGTGIAVELEEGELLFVIVTSVDGTRELDVDTVEVDGDTVELLREVVGRPPGIVVSAG